MSTWSLSIKMINLCNKILFFLSLVWKQIRKQIRKNMKNLKYFTAAILLVAISACADGQWRKTVYGDGNVVKKDREAGSFSGVRVSTGIDVFLSQGSNKSISVEADENLHEYIMTKVEGDILHVYTEANIREAISAYLKTAEPDEPLSDFVRTWRVEVAA